ncbi:MAG TPA: ferric reductase-like transmembrane domain-containing protein [Candidatus Paceibacterota bacterium]|nr:ferric reductase-like transmembrane domain-containing protein [Candidatus Paceibacterota bacterium]
MLLVISILTLIPIVIWASIEPLSLRFLDVNTATTSIGQILGLAGMTLFSINLILAGRFKFLDKYFKGLDKVYVHHSKIGSLSFSLILFHPIFLVVKYLSISIREAGLFFVPFLNMPITWGIISLILMIGLLSVTLYINLKYHVWKLSHKFMILAFFFAILHVLNISSDVSRSNLLNYYILTLAFIGLAVSFHQAFLNKFLSKKFKYKIANIKELNENVAEIEMEPVKEGINFENGQFAFFSFQSEGVSSESHPFTISSSSKDNNLKITVKNLGDFTGLLKNLKLGDKVIIDGPYGNFSYNKVESKDQIWIAGGIGITPFLSMVKNLGSEYNVDLYYSVKENKEAVYLQNLKEISEKTPNFKFNLWEAKDKGYINGNAISDRSNGLDSKDIFLCGPPSFMESLKNQFLSLGVDLNKIHYENFSFFD